MQLFIANKNYSSWSMRPWLVLKAFDLPFEEVMIAFQNSLMAAHLNKRYWRLIRMARYPYY